MRRSPLTPLAGGAVPVIQVEAVSPQLLRVRLPGEIRPGEYRICVEFPGFRECRSLTVLPFETSVQVSPRRIFNSRQETIVITGSDLGAWKRFVLEGPGIRPERMLRKIRQEKQPALAADIEPGLTAGRYRLLLVRDGEDLGLPAAEIEVRGPLAPRVEKIDPPWLRRYREGAVRLTIEGHGLGELTAANLLGSSSDCTPANILCRLVSRSDRRLEFEISELQDIQDGADNVLTFADGTQIRLENLRSFNPIVPWDSGLLVCVRNSLFPVRERYLCHLGGLRSSR